MRGHRSIVLHPVADADVGATVATSDGLRGARSEDLRRLGPVTVQELKQAWTTLSNSPGLPGRTWTPDRGEVVVPVIGCVGSAGTTVVALALAQAFRGPTRLVECCARSATGLGGASDAELGEIGESNKIGKGKVGEPQSDWRRGLRSGVLLERCGIEAWNPAELPAPALFPGHDPGRHSARGSGPNPGGDVDPGRTGAGHVGARIADHFVDDSMHGVEETDRHAFSAAATGRVGAESGSETLAPAHVVHTVLDLGWRSGEVLSSGSWLPTALSDADRVLVVAPATEPGLRRLERTVADLGPDRVVVAVIGPRVRRWPPRLRSSTQPHTRRLLETGRVVCVPVDSRLALCGVTEDPLPALVLAAGRELHELLTAPRTTNSDEVQL